MKTPIQIITDKLFKLDNPKDFTQWLELNCGNLKEVEHSFLNHHLEQFAEECKSKVQLIKSSNCGSYLDAIVDTKSIDQTLTDYKLKNNIK